jgi:hypothetical protein
VERPVHQPALIAAAQIAAALLLAAGAAAAAEPDHPPGDITGVWMAQEAYMHGTPLKPAPALTPDMAALKQRRAEAVAKGYVRSLSNMMCQGRAGPAMSLIRSPFEIFEGFGRVTLIFEDETFAQPRTIYLREPNHPADVFPSPNGHSIGHWEGKGARRVLVVDTIGLNGRSGFPNDIPASPEAHIVERFSVSADGKVLTDDVTMTDPKALQKPWAISLKYDRKPDSEERMEVVCEPDLDAIKTLDLPALKDADPEVARLLNPDTRATDPALKIAKPALK